MTDLTIPGRGLIQLKHLVSDVNGTLALDGTVQPAVGKAFTSLQDRLILHLLTADTHGRQDQIDQQLGMTAVRIPPGSESATKARYVLALGQDQVAAIGQGANDAGMLKAAAIGICVGSAEGLALEALLASDVFVPDVLMALELFEHPLRLVSSLRQ